VGACKIAENISVKLCCTKNCYGVFLMRIKYINVYSIINNIKQIIRPEIRPIQI